jgi:hypothetical protein
MSLLSLAIIGVGSLLIADIRSGEEPSGWPILAWFILCALAAWIGWLVPVVYGVAALTVLLALTAGRGY